MIDDPTAFQIGSYIYSRSRFHADSPDQPVGGIVIDIYDRVDTETGDIERCCRVVAVWRGQVRYETIPIEDVEPGLGGGLIRSDVLKGVATHLQRDAAARNDPFCHDPAMRAIQRALMTKGHRAS